MAALTLIVTMYGERATERAADMAGALRAQTRKPDLVYVLYEDTPLPDFAGAGGVVIYHQVETPRDAGGRPTLIPYSLAINFALDAIADGYVAYMTDDSLPAPEKFERMAAALDEHPAWGVVYCGQNRNGSEWPTRGEIGEAAYVIDHTQVMHRLTADRWPTDMNHVRVGDAEFWRALHVSLGAFYPVDGSLDAISQDARGVTARY